jgi:hypothetical protein
VTKSADVERYLSALGSKYSRFEGSDSWLVSLDSKAGEFYLTVTAQGKRVAFVINPLIDRPEIEPLARLAYHLCRLNHDTFLVKCFVDEELDVGICIEMPNIGLTEQAFKEAYGAIIIFLEAEFEEIRQLGGDPQAASRYLPSAGASPE